MVCRGRGCTPRPHPSLPLRPAPCPGLAAGERRRVVEADVTLLSPGHRVCHPPGTSAPTATDFLGQQPAHASIRLGPSSRDLGAFVVSSTQMCVCRFLSSLAKSPPPPKCRKQSDLAPRKSNARPIPPAARSGLLSQHPEGTLGIAAAAVPGQRDGAQGIAARGGLGPPHFPAVSTRSNKMIAANCM